MRKAFLLLICAPVAAWLVFTFGFGMLVSVSAAAVAAFLFSSRPVREPDAARCGQATTHHTTRLTSL